MTERTAPLPGQPLVCPFIALADDRDVRLSVPDHRHRCFAEEPAAQRALAHQAAYCLAAAFPACPTFADWARREAAPPAERRSSDGRVVAPEPISTAASAPKPVPVAPEPRVPEAPMPAPFSVPAPAPPAPATPPTPATPPADEFGPPEGADDELLETDEDRAGGAPAFVPPAPSLPAFSETGPRAVPIPISTPGPRRAEEDFSRLRPDREDAIPVDGSSPTGRAGWSDPPPWLRDRERQRGASGDRPATAESGDDPAEGNRFDRSFGGYAAPAHEPAGPPPSQWTGADAGPGRPVGPGSEPRPVRHEATRPAARNDSAPHPVPPTGPQPGAAPTRGSGLPSAGRPSSALWGDAAASPPVTPPPPPVAAPPSAAPQYPVAARSWAPREDAGQPSPGHAPDAQAASQDPHDLASGGTGPASRHGAIGYAPVADPSHGRGAKDVPAPSWERPRRMESYPPLKSSTGGLATPVKLGLALLVVVVVVFSVPFLWKAVSGGNSGASGPSPSLDASARATASPPPTPSATPAPTPVTYTVKSNDTMSKIAKRFGVTIEQLQAANPQIKDLNKIKLGDKIAIPTPTGGNIIKSATPTPAPSK